MLDIKKYIDDLYESENEGAMHEACMTKITIRCTAESAGMFNAISSRFNLTRFELLEVFLNDLSTQLFNSLNDDDKNEIAKNADIETTAI
ncbi:TPA: hypothetical protein ACWV7F_004987, partial [Salmonella enterica subsp. enterica serovar Muenchen]